MSLAFEVPIAEQTVSPAHIQHLLYSSRRVATGLHWSDSSDWFREDPAWTRSLWHGDRLVGLLACTPPCAGSSWLRLCALADGLVATDAFHYLWRELSCGLRQPGGREVHLLGSRQDWLRDCLVANGFVCEEKVVSLSRPLNDAPSCLAGAGYIRRATDCDLDRLMVLDEAAFPPHWRMSAGELRRALRQAANFTVLELDGAIRAFQITTRCDAEAHLSRLAVHPDYQGRGLGSRLLADVIRRCRTRDLASLTVNTQAHNRRSLRLYRRFGFRRTGPRYQVWSKQIMHNPLRP